MSLVFYGYFNISYLPIIVISIIANYIINYAFEKLSNKVVRKMLLFVAIVGNLGVLFYFKYFDFFISNVNVIFGTQYTLKNIVLPLGISFFTFQQLSYVIDSYRGEVPKYGLVYYASFVTFFPQLIAGPIVTHDELVPQFKDVEKKRFNFDNFSKGLYIFALGLGKKVIIADTLGNVANYGFSNILGLNSTNAIITMLAYTIQIYFDFSGYCDMAIGIGKMFNIDLPLNFDSPYKALTITEFWKRWHITLTRFLTKYLYYPLGGNRKGKVRTYLNIMIVFLASGLWHGANWTFIFWGFLHGMFSVITRACKKFFDKCHPVFNWIITFSFVNVAWVFFRADSIKEGFQLLKRIFVCNFGTIDPKITQMFNFREFVLPLSKIFPNLLSEYPQILLLMFFVVVFILMLGRKNAYEKMLSFEPGIINGFVVVVLMVWCIFSFSGISTFLYWNF